jgi:hypothetical protein
MKTTIQHFRHESIQVSYLFLFSYLFIKYL